MTGIVDAHHHIWRLRDLPWLSGEIVPRIFGPYGPIQRDYLANEFIREAAGSGVERSVYVQVNWPPERSVDEVRWVQQVANDTGWPHAIVGSADMFADDCEATFDAHATNAPLMRGIRLQLHWHENELYRFAAGPNEMANETFRRNLALLPGYDWIFELQVFAPQMTDAAVLVAETPQVTFVLEHAGMLESSDPEAVERWRRGIRLLAQYPNVSTKLSGLGTFVRGLDPELIAMIVTECLEVFGPERCMFGSNFPVEKLWTDYSSLLGAHRKALEPHDDAAQRAVLGDTARRVYRLA